MEIKTVDWNKLSSVEQDVILQRPSFSTSETVRKQVKNILAEVKDEQDAAIFRLTRQFDHVELESLMVSSAEIESAKEELSAESLAAIEYAIEQVKNFHSAQKNSPLRIETDVGVHCERVLRPIQKVGFYIPGGTAPLVSTVIMLAIPAQIAGCQLKIICTPPRKDGNLDPHILVAANLCHVEHIYKCGGAQAIAAMAYGTKTIPRVDKIFGPGNTYVTEAKKQIVQDDHIISCDFPAGPSELLVIADHNANAKIIAADLLSQAEHSNDAQVILVTDSVSLAENVKQNITVQLSSLSRKEILNNSLQQARIIITENILQAIEICNLYASEHVSLQVQDPEQYVHDIIHAGTVFLGEYTAETFGDYVTGSNHVLPTAGYVRNHSGLSLHDFVKFINIQTVTKQGFSKLDKHAEHLAEIEKLDAHRNAVTIRRQELL